MNSRCVRVGGPGKIASLVLKVSRVRPPCRVETPFYELVVPYNAALLSPIGLEIWPIVRYLPLRPRLVISRRFERLVILFPHNLSLRRR